MSCFRFYCVVVALAGFMFAPVPGASAQTATVNEQPNVSTDQGISKTEGNRSAADSEEKKALHDKLAKYLSGTKWTGQFTMEGNAETRTEHYEIISAEKGEIGDYWNLIARIKYGDHDATIPLPPIEIKFAGKTPVITVDQAFFPGFGKFDARVLIRKGQYAGTWAHSGGVGGHLFGKIEKMDPADAKKKLDAIPANGPDSKK